MQTELITKVLEDLSQADAEYGALRMASVSLEAKNSEQR